MYPNTNLNCLVTVFSTLYKVIYQRTLYVRPEVQNNTNEKAIVSNLSNTILKGIGKAKRLMGDSMHFMTIF